MKEAMVMAIGFVMQLVGMDKTIIPVLWLIRKVNAIIMNVNGGSFGFKD